jgi:hypothetical protein
MVTVVGTEIRAALHHVFDRRNTRIRTTVFVFTDGEVCRFED